MKKLKTQGFPAHVTAFPKPPAPPTPPPPMLASPPAESFSPPSEVPMPPMPPPPDLIVIPTSYEGLRDLAVQVGMGQMTDKALVWATLAAAAATNRQADLIDELLGYLQQEEVELGNGETGLRPSPFSREIADGVAGVAAALAEKLEPKKKK